MSASRVLPVIGSFVVTTRCFPTSPNVYTFASPERESENKIDQNRRGNLIRIITIQQMKVLVKFHFITTILDQMMSLKSRHMKVLKYASFVKLENEFAISFIS